MDAGIFNRIKSAFQRRGGIIDQSDDAQRWLDKRGAEAATYDAETILFRQNPTRVEVFEEFIHTAQWRRGRATGNNIVEMEIEAAEKLIRCAKNYKLTPQDVAAVQNRLNNLLKQLNQ